MANILVYKEIVPNNNGTAYYYASIFSKYKSQLSSKLVDTLTPDKYVLANNTLRFAINSTFTKAVAMQLSYIIYEDGDFHKCYYINNVNIISDMIYCDITEDLWGSHIDKIDPRRISIKRANVDFGANDGKFIQPNLIKPSFTTDAFVASPKYYVIATITESYSSGAIFGSTATYTKLYVYPTQLSASGVPAIVEQLGGVKCVTGLSTASKAQSLKIYILPTVLLTIPSSAESRAFDTSYLVKTEMGEVITTESISLKDIGLAGTKSVDYTYTINASNMNKKFIAGTYLDGVELDAVVGTNRITYYAIFSSDNVQVIVGNNSRQADITSSFTVGFTQQANENTLEKMMKGINMLEGFIAPAIAAATGNVAGAVVGAVGATTNIVAQQTEFQPSHFLGNGTGYMTIATGGLLIRLHSAEHSEDALNNNYLYGLEYDGHYVYSLSTFFGYSRLNTRYPYYIKCDFTDNVKDVNPSFNSFIHGIFNQGCYLIQCT